MPEYQFNVLCMNDSICDMVMDNMKQEYGQPVEKIFDIKQRDGTGDHFIKLYCDDIDDADQKSRKMIQRYAESIRAITVKPL